MTDLITEELVVLDLKATDKVDATRQITERLQTAGRVTDLEGFLADVAAVKGPIATDTPAGVGLVHARSEHVTEPSLGLGRVSDGLDVGASHSAPTLVFLLATPAGAGSQHQAILTSLTRIVARPAVRQRILDAPDASSVASFVQSELAGREAREP